MNDHLSHFYSSPFGSCSSSSGLQSLTHKGCIVRRKVIEEWRKIFIKDNIYEVDIPTLTPQEVFVRSGHTKKFTDRCVNVSISDKMVRTERVDHLLNSVGIEYDEDMTIDDTISILNKHVPNVLTDSIHDKNLMHNVSCHYYLRPEHAQGIIMEAKRVKETERCNLPFGVAHVGRAYRNEISPRQFTRLQEFIIAEVEYLYYPNVIPDISTDKEALLIYKDGTEGSLSDAKLHPYIIMFMVKMIEFLDRIGMPYIYRFKQHSEGELALYASDCWDLECFVDAKWLECAGIADRGCYDCTNQDVYFKTIDVQEESIVPVYDKIKEVDPEHASDIIQAIKKNDLDHELVFTDMYKKVTVVNKKKVFPHVVEPSIGIDRLMYALLYNVSHKREEARRIYTSLPTCVAPYDVALIQLSNDDDIMKIINDIDHKLKNRDISTYIDRSSVDIGKRYVRADSTGIKYCITVDFDSIENRIIWLRDRDSMKQVTYCMNNKDDMECLIQNITHDLHHR